MSVHMIGDGVAWTGIETLDVDQAHGLDHRQLNHLSIALRKRSNKEHKAFGDLTVGAEHLPGGCRILGIVDSTADLTKGAGDASIDVTDGLFKGRGIIYDQTKNALWCYTGDGTVSGNPYLLKWAPYSICTAADFTWSGAHEFDGSVDFSGPLKIDGSVDISGPVTISRSLKCASAVDVTGTLSCTTNNVYDSSIFEVSAAGAYVKNHQLGANNLNVQVFCCSYNAGPLCSSAWSQSGFYLYGANSGLLAMDISANNLTVQAGAQNAIVKWGVGAAGVFKTDLTGYARVIAIRLT